MGKGGYDSGMLDAGVEADQGALCGTIRRPRGHRGGFNTCQAAYTTTCRQQEPREPPPETRARRLTVLRRRFLRAVKQWRVYLFGCCHCIERAVGQVLDAGGARLAAPRHKSRVATDAAPGKVGRDKEEG